MSDKAVSTYPSKKIYSWIHYDSRNDDKAVNRCFFVFDYITNQYKTQDLFNSMIYEDPFSIRYIPDQHKTQQIFDKAIDDFLAELKSVVD